ncbi:hypothetical protein C8F04DRAFT_218000 [Mycena alexandri]|uniref:Monopolin complex subunit Csm1/Pcs1 C-terminal domain-containing protein n=1 Tax=Mycena alexandri TaxID=1745969 RepID=A0AAD6TIP9_9AGAR|nr:hypothetical protein C8F04DRAFT_218000 [Mycena alexandri]
MSATGSERVTRTRAGSSKPVSKKRTQTKEVEEEEESDDFTAAAPGSAVEDDDEVMEVDPPRTRKPASRAAPKSAAKGKGKAKAESAAIKKQAPSREDIEVVDDEDEAGPSGTARSINNATSNNRAPKPTGDNAARQIDKLKQQLDAANGHIKDLSKQLEESYRVRHTEPEKLLQQQKEKYEDLLRVKDLLIKQQEEMLSQKEPLSREAKTSVLHMVTREHADAEKRSAEEQVTYWKEQADQRDKLLDEKDQEIVDLKQTHNDLRYELKTEQEKSQKAARNPPSTSRARGPNALLGSDDPKHSELVRFYEDVTNLLVTDIKIQEPKYFNLDEWSLTCIYTYSDKSASEASKRSLAFLLRFTYDPFDSSADVESIADLDKAAQYTPLNLELENPDFIEGLQFLNTGFTFPRTQLPIFFSSLVENMKAACENEESEPGSDDQKDDTSMQDVQIVD